MLSANPRALYCSATRRWLLTPFIHEFVSALRFIDLRDRLRCPECRSVGTWKPHGGWFDKQPKLSLTGPQPRYTRRWMCKWCGYYVGPESESRVHLGDRVWELGEGSTPEKYLLMHTRAWPWRG